MQDYLRLRGLNGLGEASFSTPEPNPFLEACADFLRVCLALCSLIFTPAPLKIDKFGGGGGGGLLEVAFSSTAASDSFVRGKCSALSVSVSEIMSVLRSDEDLCFFCGGEVTGAVSRIDDF